MTREEMQHEALTVVALIEAALSIICGSTEETCTLLEMAQERSKKLNRALDSVNVQFKLKDQN